MTATTAIDVAQARLAWGQIRAGDVLRRSGSAYTTSDGRQVPAWVVRLHWGTAFVDIGNGQLALPWRQSA